MIVYKFAQMFCYLCGVVFLIVTLMKRASLQLADAESFATLLLIVCGTLLFMCLGTLGGIAGRVEQSTPASRPN